MTSRNSEANRAASSRKLVGFIPTGKAVVRSALLGLSAVALAAAFAIPTSVPAAADPPLTVAEAKAQIAQLETDAAAIDQDYAGVQEKIVQGKADLALKQSDVKAQTAKVARMKAQVGQVALAQFQNRDLDTAAQLFVTPDTEGFLSQISTVEKVNENQNSVLQDFQQEQAGLADLEHSAKTDLAALDQQQKELAKLRAASEQKVTESKAVLAKLTADQQRQIALEEQKAAAEAKAEAERNGTETSRDGTRESDVPAVDRVRPWRQGARLRPRTAGQALPVRRNRPERVRLLGSHRCRVARSRSQPVAYLAVPVPRRTSGREVRPAAR